MSDWQKKVWGWTRCILDTPHFSRHELVLSAGGYCSWHFHRNRANRFIVLSGEVLVATFVPGERITTHHLVAGQIDRCEVDARYIHQFRVIESGSMIEEYFPQFGTHISNDDIVRVACVGGVVADGSWDGLDKVLYEKIMEAAE